MATSSFAPSARAVFGGTARRAARCALAISGAGAVALAGVTGSARNPLSPALPPGAGPIAPLRWLAAGLGLAHASPWTIGAVAMAAAGLLAAGFALLAAAAWRGGVTARTLVWIALAFHALAIAMPVVGSRDVFAYALYGRIVAVHHLNPFTIVPADIAHDAVLPYVDRQWLHTPPVYGPAFLALAAALARAFRSPASIALAFKLVAAAGSLSLLGLSLRLSSALAPERRAFTAALVGANPSIVFVAVGGGHVDALVGVAVVAALVLLVRARRRPASGATGAIALLAVGALIKFVVAIPLVLVIAWDVRRRPAGARLRRAVMDLGLAGAIAVLGYLPFAQTHDPSFGLTYLFPFGSLVAPVFFVNKVVVEIVANAAGPDASVVAALLVRVGFGALFFACAARLARGIGDADADGEPGRVVRAVAWALLLVSLSFQWLYAWYVAWFAPLAWSLPRRARAIAIALSAVLPLTTATIIDDARTPVIARGLSRLDFAVVAPCLLVALGALVLELRADPGTARIGERERYPSAAVKTETSPERAASTIAPTRP